MKVYSIFKSVTDDAATKNPAWAAFLIARQSSSEYSTLKAPKALLHFRTFLCTFFSTILSAETRRGCPERHSSEHNFALGTIQMPSFSVAVRLDVLHHDKASRNTEASHGRGTERPPRRHAARAACREPKLAAGFFAAKNTPFFPEIIRSRGHRFAFHTLFPRWLLGAVKSQPRPSPRFGAEF